jgi:hypothetical protein
MYLCGLELRLQYCLRNLRIACKAVQVAMPLGHLKLEFKKCRQHLKIFLPSMNLIPTKAYPTIPLSAQSNLVRRYL